MSIAEPIEWFENNTNRKKENSDSINRLFPKEVTISARNFHKQIKEYRITPLKSLAHLASRINVGGIWVKDESQRLNLNSFKGLGGSFAVYNFLKRKLNLDKEEISLSDLTSKEIKNKLGNITFAAATDGNHGMGIAWSAKQVGFDSVIYVHKNTTKPRINSIERNGAKVVIVDGTYDDAVRQATKDAEKNGWQVISDTSWDNYEDVPKWVMQGYTTMFSETQEQLAAQGLIKPTHIFVQAGVGALAASTIGYYRQIFGINSPKFVVVEPTNAPCLYNSAKKSDGKPHNFVGELDTMMAGLACGDPSPLAWDILRDYTDAFIISPDYVAAKGMRVYGVPLEGDPFIVSGESGAVTLGVLLFTMSLPKYTQLREYLNITSSSQILLINSEGNTDPDDFRQIVWEGSNSVPKEYRTTI